MPLYDKLPFFPIKAESYAGLRTDDLSIKDVYFSSKNGARLHGWYIKAPDERAVVHFSHGNGGNISHRLPIYRELVKLGLSVLTYDYQGYGRSEGKPTLGNICDDGFVVYDYLVNELKYPADRVIVYGESLGGAVAGCLCSERPSRAIILQSTFSTLPHVAKEKLSLVRVFPDFLFPDQGSRTIQMVVGKHSPLLILHGTDDSIIPVEEAEILFRAASQPKTFVKIDGAGHNEFASFADQYFVAIKQFIESRLD